VSLAAIASRVDRRSRLIIGGATGATVVSAVAVAAGLAGVPVFAATAIALALLAAVVGEATDEIGARLSPAATGILQSALGNLPELFISLFALQAGLVAVVVTALVGSILANILLVLGIALFVGGRRHGRQHFESRGVRDIAMLLLLAVAAIVIPTLATAPGAPDAGHAQDLSVVVSIVLLVIFAASVPFAVKAGESAATSRGMAEGTELGAWPMVLAVVVLAVAALCAAFVADWFVASLRPAMAALGMSEAFAGLVVVAIAGNAVENVVGVSAAARNKVDLSLALILNSALQVALALTPALVLISMVMGGATLTLVVSPLLAGALVFSALLATIIVFDGESNALEGLALVGLYVIIAASVWWGPAIGT